jgi:phosphate transport system permease protein
MENPNRFEKKRLRLDWFIQCFFGGNAFAAMAVLALITLFLMREGVGFFPQNLRNLRLYRLAGLEYVDLMRGQVEGHTALNRKLQALRLQALNALRASNPDLDAANAALAGFDAFANTFDSAVDPLRSFSSDLTDTVSTLKERAKVREDAITQRQLLLASGKTEEAAKVTVGEIDFVKEVAVVRGTLPAYRAACDAYRAQIEQLLASAPPLPAPGLETKFATFQKEARAFLATLPATLHAMETWDQQKPVRWSEAVASFLFGREWITNSFWQDFYGFLPLLTGSLLVSAIALVIAIPLGVAAAIYVSELASPTEQAVIKPYIEFIAAIPSVVLGFFGVAVLGTALRDLTHWAWLSWVPGFPISERLTATTAGCLLALMAVPTIFSLSEDALNSVPRSLREASYAMGATKLQTIFRILVPAALSGIISASLLGFGRVIGETMVVLLCAGNRIAIPDFTQGISALFQPVHTMTGIIAQEMGEIPPGHIQYRALFMVGLVLFGLSLVINWLAQAAVRRFKISIG